MSVNEMRAFSKEQNVPFRSVLSSLCSSSATAYRTLDLTPKKVPTSEFEWAAKPTQSHPRALKKQEISQVLSVLNSDEFVDKAPKAIFNQLLDQGRYLCSSRTMYRILASENPVRERRKVARARNFAAPELLATGPNQVWSWDISKLRGQEKWTYFYLYVVMDIFSRKIVGWSIFLQETGILAETVISKAAESENIKPGQLTIHSDRGGPMRSKTLSELFSDLCISKSFSRPHVSNDNPYSEAMFKTVKYMPTFPERFGTLQEARRFMRYFVEWYNSSHMHSGIEYFTPDSVHNGQHVEIKNRRDAVLAEAFLRTPHRFAKGIPSANSAPKSVWINKPKNEEQVMVG